MSKGGSYYGKKKKKFHGYRYQQPAKKRTTLDDLMREFQVVETGPKAKRAAIEEKMNCYLFGGLSLPEGMYEKSDSLGRPIIRIKLHSAIYIYSLDEVYGDLKAVRSHKDLESFYEKYPDKAAINSIPQVQAELAVLSELYPVAA